MRSFSFLLRSWYTTVATIQCICSVHSGAYYESLTKKRAANFKLLPPDEKQPYSLWEHIKCDSIISFALWIERSQKIDENFRIERKTLTFSPKKKKKAKEVIRRMHDGKMPSKFHCEQRIELIILCASWKNHMKLSIDGIILVALKKMLLPRKMNGERKKLRIFFRYFLDAVGSWMYACIVAYTTDVQVCERDREWRMNKWECDIPIVYLCMKAKRCCLFFTIGFLSLNEIIMLHNVSIYSADDTSTALYTSTLFLNAHNILCVRSVYSIALFFLDLYRTWCPLV